MKWILQETILWSFLGHTFSVLAIPLSLSLKTHTWKEVQLCGAHHAVQKLKLKGGREAQAVDKEVLFCLVCEC